MSENTDGFAGALVGLAAGDALGAGYEFSTPSGPVEMIGGGLGPWAPGEWTDDTQMALCIAEVTASGVWDLDAIGQGFWTGTPRARRMSATRPPRCWAPRTPLVS